MKDFHFLEKMKEIIRSKNAIITIAAPEGISRVRDMKKPAIDEISPNTRESNITVSYTHLTLPTILLV